MSTEKTLSKQQQRVYTALCQPGGITAGELKDRYGIMDGRKIISDLLSYGVPVIKEWEEGTNRYGEKTRYKRYRLSNNG